MLKNIRSAPCRLVKCAHSMPLLGLTHRTREVLADSSLGLVIAFITKRGELQGKTRKHVRNAKNSAQNLQNPDWAQGVNRCRWAGGAALSAQSGTTNSSSGLKAIAPISPVCPVWSISSGGRSGPVSKFSQLENVLLRNPAIAESGLPVPDL